MDAKKLTMAVSFMMVLAAAFVLVVPSESNDAAAFEITDAHFQEGQTGIYLKVALSDSVSGGNMTLSFGDEVIKTVKAIPAGSSVSTKVGTTLEEGTYLVVVSTEKGTAQKEISWPTPVSHSITVLPAVGGKVTVDPTAALPGETITVSYTEDDNYELTALYVNGKAIEGTTFEMPNEDVTVQGLFNKIIVMYNVTFMVSTLVYDEQEVLTGSSAVAPADPEVIGAYFAGWYTADGEKFDITSPIMEDTVLYAVYTAEDPSTEQTSKLVASMVYDEDGATFVATAYDDGIIGKGTATVTVLQEVDFFGLKAYVEVGTFTIDFDTSESYAYQNITEEASEYITESGNYAMVAEIVLENETTASSNYIVFDIEINEQA
jgi:hypothetical protein